MPREERLALSGKPPQKKAMQSQNPIIADLVKLANSAAGTLAGMSREARESARERLREAFGGLDFVSREEFETVKAMAQKAREQADALEARLAALEARLAKK
jgi:BMFP domain-containing protein YqiC